MGSKREYVFAVIPGDGTGPEVIREGLKVLKAASEMDGFRYKTVMYDLGGERYKRTGEVLPDSIVDEIRQMDAIYFGAIGHPEVPPGILEKGVLLKLRFDLDLYINLRPVILYPGVNTPLKGKGPEDINFVVVRENTEGLYCDTGGILKKGTPDEVAIQASINSRKGVERCIRFAFDYARQWNRKKKVTLCGKTNVLTYAFDLWERTFYEVAKDYPDIKTEYAHVDATCVWMIESPEMFDVIVTDNMFGDIITDLGAMLQGGMGIAPGGNIHPGKVSMFEPIGGTAPRFTGQNVINPLAAILAGKMMLEHLSERKAAQRIEDAVKKAVSKDIKGMAVGKMGMGTTDVGDLIAKYIREDGT